MGLGCLPERPALAQPRAYRPAYPWPGPLGTLSITMIYGPISVNFIHGVTVLNVRLAIPGLDSRFLHNNFPHAGSNSRGLLGSTPATRRHNIHPEAPIPQGGIGLWGINERPVTRVLGTLCFSVNFNLPVYL